MANQIGAVKRLLKKPSAGLSSRAKSNIVKRAKKGQDIGKKGKNFQAVAAKAAQHYGSMAAGQRVAATSMWRNMKR